MSIGRADPPGRPQAERNFLPTPGFYLSIPMKNLLALLLLAGLAQAADTPAAPAKDPAAPAVAPATTPATDPAAPAPTVDPTKPTTPAVTPAPTPEPEKKKEKKKKKKDA